MTVLQPPAFVAGTYGPALLRAYPILNWLQDPAASVVRPLGGIIPRGGTQDMGISVAGSNVTVAAGACLVPGTESSTQFGYEVINDAPKVIGIATAPVGQTRRDLIVVRVRDSAYSGSDNDADIILVSGTPASSGAVLPSAPNNSLVLAEITQVGTGSPTATAKAGYTVAPGGIRPARGGTADDGVAPQYAGQYRDLNGILQRGTGPGGTWQPVVDNGEWQQVTAALKSSLAGASVGLGTGGSAVCRYQIAGKAMRIRYHFVFGASPAGGSGGLYTELPPGVTLHPTGIQVVTGRIRVPPSGSYSGATSWNAQAVFDPATPTQVAFLATAAEYASYLLAMRAGGGSPNSPIPIIPSGNPIIDGTRIDFSGTVELA